MAKKTKQKARKLTQREEEKLAKCREEMDKVKSAVIGLYPGAEMVAVDPEFSEVTFMSAPDEYSAQRDFSIGDVIFKFESKDDSMQSLKFTYIIV